MLSKGLDQAPKLACHIEKRTKNNVATIRAIRRQPTCKMGRFDSPSSFLDFGSLESDPMVKKIYSSIATPSHFAV